MELHVTTLLLRTVSGVRRTNKVNARRARLVPGWVTVFGRVYHLGMVCNKPTRSTQPCIHPGSRNRVPASARVRAGMCTCAGWQVTLCDPMWHVSSRSGVATLQLGNHTLVTYMQIHVVLQQRGWSRWTRDMSQCFGFLGDLFSFISLLLGSRCVVARRPILTIYTSCDVIPRSNVPFGGPVVTIPI